LDEGDKIMIIVISLVELTSYDEIHFPLNISNFRPEMDDLWTLMLLVQSIDLTATLSMMSESKLELKMIMPNTKFIRTSTNRMIIRYGVYITNQDESDEDFIIRIVEKVREKMTEENKIVIYARTIQTCERLYVKLFGLLYNRDLPEKE
jgi:superfamily II DNA helicase RecQ